METIYAFFTYDFEDYVIQFKIDESLFLDGNCFVCKDSNLDWRSRNEIITYAALGTKETDDKMQLTHLLRTRDAFNELQSRGVKRWKPKHEIVGWY